MSIPEQPRIRFMPHVSLVRQGVGKHDQLRREVEPAVLHYLQGEASMEEVRRQVRQMIYGERGM